jgi:uncharacterized protein (TIGR02246 family)
LNKRIFSQIFQVNKKNERFFENLSLYLLRDKKGDRKMKNYILLAIATLILMSANSYAQTDAKHANDEKAIRQVVQNIADAWAVGDAVKFANNYTDDVDYTVWNGHQIHGREENIKGHQEIFDTFYKGTMIKSEVKKIRFLTDDVAAVHIESRMYRDGKRVEEVPTVTPLLIFKKEKTIWRVAVFQNTPIIKRGELVVGRNDRKMEEKEK